MILAVLLAGACAFGISYLNLVDRRDVPAHLADKLERHHQALSSEGDRLLAKAGVHSTEPSNGCGFDPARRPPTHRTQDADPDLKSVLDDFGISRRYVSYCTVVFEFADPVGSGSNHPLALLYKGTELYALDGSCDGLMGASKVATRMSPDWYLGFNVAC